MTLRDTPSGDCDVVSFELAGQPFMAISAGPLFQFNPSVSFQVKCKTKEEVDGLWEKLSKGGRALMPLDKYPFSERYGWLQDKYGLSWQLMFVGDTKITHKVTPMLLFVGKVAGKAEEAINFYTSVFKKASSEVLARYGKGEEPDREGTVKYATFELSGTELGAMDSARQHDFAFNEAVSFIVSCEDQAEIDYFWGKLSAVPEAEQCGWLKDQYGLSWQITPREMDELMQKGTQEQIDRITQAFLPMKKLDLAELKKAYRGK
jgi:predicted 3-demethylubiquinone-9 3-methyltransferase (glyoxalase superfamily)